MPDLRAELQALVHAYDKHGGKWPQEDEIALCGAVECARVALAALAAQPPCPDSAPDAAGPTLNDIWDLCEEHDFHLERDDDSDEILLEIVRAALARWGTVAAHPGEQAAAGVGEFVAVGWCKTDEFRDAMKRGGSFNGWKEPGAGANQCDMRLYAHALPLPSGEAQS